VLSERKLGTVHHFSSPNSTSPAVSRPAENCELSLISRRTWFLQLLEAGLLEDSGISHHVLAFAPCAS
jgi:hypothetical protein